MKEIIKELIDYAIDRYLEKYFQKLMGSDTPREPDPDDGPKYPDGLPAPINLANQEPDLAELDAEINDVPSNKKPEGYGVIYAKVINETPKAYLIKRADNKQFWLAKVKVQKVDATEGKIYLKKQFIWTIEKMIWKEDNYDLPTL